jgi:thiol-disulfide isomerase/thioredoxin
VRKTTLFLAPAIVLTLLAACAPRQAAPASQQSPKLAAAKDATPAGEFTPVPGSLTDTLYKAGFSVPRTELAATDFTLQTLEGNKVSLSSYRGKLVFLSFWATWCGPCKQELPSMQALYDKLKGKGFTVVAVDLAEDSKTVKEFVKANGMTFPVLLDTDGKVGGTYEARSIPTNYLLDRDGKILARIVGYDGTEWTSPERVALFEKLLAR